MNRNNRSKILLFFCLIILLFSSTSVLAAQIPIGQNCNTGNNSACITNKCEKSNLDADKNSFCVCSTALDCENHFGKEPNGTWECKNGLPSTNALHYCLSSVSGPKKAINTGNTAPGGECGLATIEEDIDTANSNEFTAVAPQLAIPIPGLPKFTNYKITTGETFSSPWIARYIVAVYSYAVTLASIASVGAMIIGGLMYMMSAANQAMISRSKSIIFGSISGLIIILTAHMILQFINPNLTNLHSISSETVQTDNLDEYLVDFGSLGPEFKGTPSTFDGTVPPGGIPGSWREVMSSKLTCGESNNGSLPMKERQDRLATIINVFKVMSSDNGGAIYTHGGAWDCGYSNANERFLLRSLSNLIIKGDPAEFSPGFLESPCGKFLSSIASQLSGKYSPDSPKITAFLSDSCNFEIANKCSYKEKNDNVTDTKAPSFARSAKWKYEYDYLLTKRAEANGMVCGDCGSYMVGLFHDCFDKSYTSDMIKRAGDGNTVRFKLSYSEFRSDIPKYVGMLQFGDMIRMQDVGHYVLYTGGRSDVGFEIMEMGGGGEGDTVGKDIARANAGTPLSASGVTSHNSAVDFFTDMSMKFVKITAYGVIDQK